MNDILPLELQGIGLDAGDARLLSDIDLRIAPGRRTIIMGPNGAGKSLLLRICHGLVAPTRGRVVWADGQQRPRAQAMVFQRPVMLRRCVRDNLDHALSLAGLTRAERRLRTDAALDRFGLMHMADRGARLLSGGEQQRLALARAWATAPRILFLDEPTSALDPGSTRAIEEALLAFSAEGMTLVMTTHDLGQVRRLAQDIVFLDRGRIAEKGPASALLSNPQSPAARAYLAGDLVWQP